MNAKAKPTKQEIEMSMRFLSIASGKGGDYEGYEKDKKSLRALPPSEYEKAVKAAAERRGI